MTTALQAINSGVTPSSTSSPTGTASIVIDQPRRSSYHPTLPLMASLDSIWINHVATAVGQPRPRCRIELATLLDIALKQKAACVAEPFPLRRAPRIDDAVDIDAVLFATFGEAFNFDTPFDTGPDGSRGERTEVGNRQVDCHASDIQEAIDEIDACGLERAPVRAGASLEM